MRRLICTLMRHDIIVTFEDDTLGIVFRQCSRCGRIFDLVASR